MIEVTYYDAYKTFTVRGRAMWEASCLPRVGEQIIITDQLTSDGAIIAGKSEWKVKKIVRSPPDKVNLYVAWE